MTATAPEPTGPSQTGGNPTNEHGALYWIAGIIVVVLAVVGLITYGANKSDQKAQEKAAQLTQSLQSAGLPVPVDQEIITRSLGTDGGAVCDNPASALGKAVLADQLVNGASFVGRRPVIVDRRVLQGELLILQTYCPEKVQEYRDKIDDFKTDDVLKD
jgi:hypothetical protein